MAVVAMKQSGAAHAAPADDPMQLALQQGVYLEAIHQLADAAGGEAIKGLSGDHLLALLRPVEESNEAILCAVG